MNLQQQIKTFLREWQRLSQAEFEAIQATVWPELEKIRPTKMTLQPSRNAVWKKWPAQSPGDSFFPKGFSQLVASEKNECEQLQLQFQTAETKFSLHNPTEN